MACLIETKLRRTVETFMVRLSSAYVSMLLCGKIFFHHIGAYAHRINFQDWFLILRGFHPYLLQASFPNS